ncbi:MAG: hypothetical protein ABW090_02555 [Sedimenticola sp.]
MNQSDITLLVSGSDPEKSGVPTSAEAYEADQQNLINEDVSFINDNFMAENTTIEFDFDVSLSEHDDSSESDDDFYNAVSEETKINNSETPAMNKLSQSDMVSTQGVVNHIALDIPMTIQTDDHSLTTEVPYEELDSALHSSRASVASKSDNSNDAQGASNIGISISRPDVVSTSSGNDVENLLALTGGVYDPDEFVGQVGFENFLLPGSISNPGNDQDDMLAEQITSSELMLASALANPLNILPLQVTDPDGQATAIVDTDINITVEVNSECADKAPEDEVADNQDDHSRSCNADGLIQLLHPQPKSGVITDDFEDGATDGWVRSDSGTILVHDGGEEATKFLGRFSGSEGDEAVSKVYEFGKENAGKEVTVSFDVYEMGSWDFEKLYVYTNGEVATEDSFSHLFTDNAIGNIVEPCSDGERITNLAQGAAELATIASMGVGAAGAATGAAGLAIGTAGAATGALGAGTLALGTPVAALGHGGALLSAGVAGLGALSSGAAALAGTASLAAMGAGALGMFPFTHCWIMGGMMLAPAFGTALGAGIGAASGGGYGAAPGAGVGLAAGSAIGTGIVGLGMFTGTVSIGLMGVGALGAVASTALLIPSLALTAAATGVGLASEAVGLAGTAVMGAGALGMGTGALGMGTGALVSGTGALGVGAGAAGTLAGTLVTNKLEKVNTTDDKHTYELTTTLDENGSLKLGFGSSLSGSVDCESYGIDNIVIGLVDAEGTGQTSDQCGCTEGDINIDVTMDVTVNVEGEASSKEEPALVLDPTEDEDPVLSIDIDVNGEVDADSPDADQPALVLDPTEDEDPVLSIDIDVNGEVEADSQDADQPALVLDPTEDEIPVLSIDIDVNGEIEADAPDVEQPALVIEPIEEEDPSLSIDIDVNGEIEADAPSVEQPTLVLDPIEEEDPSLSIDIDVNSEIEADTQDAEQPALVLDPTEDEIPVLSIDIDVNGEIEADASNGEQPALVIEPVEEEDPSLSIDIDVNSEIEADSPSGEQPTLVLDPVEDEDTVLSIDIGINKDIEESALDDEEVVQGIKAEDVTTEEGTIDLDLLGEMLGVDLLSDSSDVDRGTLCDLVYQHYKSMIGASSTSPSGKIAASEAANDNTQSLHPATDNAAMGATSAHPSSTFEVI